MVGDSTNAPLSHNWPATDASHDLVRARESPMLNESADSGEISLGARRMPVTVTSPKSRSVTHAEGLLEQDSSV